MKPSTCRPNWIHLDLKGAIPSFAKLLEWLDWLASHEFNGIVFEYEDRLPWRTWAPVSRPGYSLQEWETVWSRCRQLGLELVPLIQVQGHLEWLLKHDDFAHWRENECYNELCPQVGEAQTKLREWIDEVFELHPDMRFFHIGADETWNLASCPKCRAVAEKEPDGKMGIYSRHIGELCRYVLEKGARPMIWADMFWRQECFGLTRQLPSETILDDWETAARAFWTENQWSDADEYFGSRVGNLRRSLESDWTDE